jgi:hypothetical protein
VSLLCILLEFFVIERLSAPLVENDTMLSGDRSVVLPESPADQGTMKSDNSRLWKNGSNQFQTGFDRRSPGRRINIRGWFVNVFCWDGILPAGVLLVPQAALWLGANRAISEFLAITMPVLAFFVRIPIGFLRIAASHCGPLMRCFQFVVFFFAAIFLVCLDALSILSMEMNNGRLWANEADLAALIILWSVYFLAMLFVLFPGWSPESCERSTIRDQSI